MRIGLNAHLLSGRAGYRSAGIHGYISNLLREMPGQAPPDWRFEAMVGAKNSAAFPSVSMARARLDTEAPLRRIIWEQALQPWRLGQYDLYHALAFVAPVILPAPMVVTVYDLSFLHFPARLSAARRLYLRAMTALTCARARRVIAISQSTARDLTAHLGVPSDRIDVTPLGYDKAAFRHLLAADAAHFRRKQRLPQRFWLYLGTLEPRKNLPLLLAAYARLAEAERLPLILGGGRGWMAREVFAAIERLELEAWVKHAGYIPAADLPFWYNCAEAFLYPSVYEGFGLPILEAMACGCPVVTTNVSSLPEVAGDAAMRLPPDDVERWAAALKALKRDDEWRATARLRSLERAGQFSWARTARLTLQSYAKALQTRALPRCDDDEVSRLETK